jgi:hypothetical protein
MTRTFLAALAAVCALAAPARAQAPDTLPPATRVAADPARGFSSAYFLYVPRKLGADSLRGRPQAMLVLPNNTALLDDDPAVHEARSRDVAQAYRNVVEHFGWALLVPAFPRPRSRENVYAHALDRDALLTREPLLRRPDLQLIAMVDDARRRAAAGGVRIDPRVLMHGHSAAGMFTNRFALMHPERIKAATVVAPGGWPMAPVARHAGRALPYPAGVADLRAVAGRGFDRARAARVPLLLILGADDTNDSVPFDDSYDPRERAVVTELFGATPIARWPAAEALYRGVLPLAMFRTYPGVGHEIPNPMWREIWAFLRAHAAR